MTRDARVKSKTHRSSGKPPHRTIFIRAFTTAESDKKVATLGKLEGSSGMAPSATYEGLGFTSASEQIHFAHF